MEEKIRDYILKLEIVLNKLLNELDDLDINMGEKLHYHIINYVW